MVKQPREIKVNLSCACMGSSPSQANASSADENRLYSDKNKHVNTTCFILPVVTREQRDHYDENVNMECFIEAMVTGRVYVRTRCNVFRKSQCRLFCAHATDLFICIESKETAVELIVLCITKYQV